MGLFSRKDPDSVDGPQSRARVPVSSEAQAAQWRAQARRRLVGAVALVLAAVIALPMVLDDEPVPVASDIPIVIPDRNRPHTPQFADRTPEVVQTRPVASNATTTVAPRQPSVASEPRRTDDGSRALALLEGRAAVPVNSDAAYVLQLAAYSTQTDAQARRDKLRGAGVVNVFVEEAIVNEKPQYRLRVGPFPTREAAQSAQTRLRALGYDNGFVAAQ